MSHTPGPWEALWPKFDSVIVDDEERVIASVSFSDHGDKECEANAWLIAAAPELLSALKFLLELGADDDRRIAAEQAIAKAEGRITETDLDRAAEVVKNFTSELTCEPKRERKV